jgi:hypothetical protein
MADTPDALRAIDREVHLHVFGRTTQGACVLCPKDFYLDPTNRCRHIPPYSSDIAAAMQVAVEVKQRSFSVRHRFIEALRDQMARPAGAMIDPSWWIFFLTPEMICRAALSALAVTGTREEAGE